MLQLKKIFLFSLLTLLMAAWMGCDGEEQSEVTRDTQTEDTSEDTSEDSSVADSPEDSTGQDSEAEADTTEEPESPRDTADEETPELDVQFDPLADAPELPECDEDRRPIVMVHGFLAAGDTYANHAMRFTSNGYCVSHLFVFDWNTLNRRTDHTANLDAFIDWVLAATGAEQVDLAGHSAGGALSYEYLEEEPRAAKVAH